MKGDHIDNLKMMHGAKELGPAYIDGIEGGKLFVVISPSPHDLTIGLSTTPHRTISGPCPECGKNWAMVSDDAAQIKCLYCQGVYHHALPKSVALLVMRLNLMAAKIILN